MAQTENFGLETFGAEGDLAQNGYKFTGQDRRTIDSLLWTLFNHDHRETSSVPMPEPKQPILTQGAGGNFLAGTTLYYRVSFRDEFNNETAASGEQQIILPSPLPTPPIAPLAVAGTGGALETGTYRYAVSFYQSSGGETRATNVNQITATTDTSVITITLPALPEGATGWKIYRKGPPDDDYYYLATVPGPATEYVDDGSVLADCHTSRPLVNNTNGGNSVTVELDPNDLPLDPRVKSWRIYRTTQSGSYSSASLVATVTQTQVGSPNLVTSYTDLGMSLLGGRPLEISATPPGVPQLDAAAVFSALSGRLPKAVAPREVSNWSVFGMATLSGYSTDHRWQGTEAVLVKDGLSLHGGDAVIGLFRDHGTDAIVQGVANGFSTQELARTVVTHDIAVERVDFHLQIPPHGLSATDAVTFQVTDGTTSVQVKAMEDAGFYSWVSSTTDQGEQEAESVAGAGGSQVPDTLALNDVAQELSLQDQEVRWEVGTLDEGSYTFAFYVRDVGQSSGSLVLEVVADNVVVAATTINAPGPIFYEPAQTLSYTVLPGGQDIELVARKTDANANAFRVDRFTYSYINPTFPEGSTVRVLTLVEGKPAFAGDRMNVTLWY